MIFNLLTEELNSGALYLSAGILIVVLLSIAILLDDKKTKLDTRCIALAGISVALSIALSFVKLFSLPQGGSITLSSLLPMLIFSYIYGTRKGVIVGLILGILNFVADPYFLHPAQFFLDYLLAFASIGVAGIFKTIKPLEKNTVICFSLGSIICAILKYLCHTLSGIFAFNMYATKDVIVYSAIYNSSVFIDIAISLILGIVILSQKSVQKVLFKY